MLGLHQTHMSYSPASVAAAAAVAVGRGGSKKPSKLTGGATSGRTAGVNNSHRRQQIVMAEMLAQEADENSIQTMRMHPIRERDAHQRQQMSHRRIVQVPPQTAEPLVIGSMPKCTSGGGGGKGGGRAATRVREHNYYQQDEETRRHQPDEEEESRHFLLRQQARQMEADNQVVLIMSDTTSGARPGANGIPIIGRRLPSKSHPAPQPPPQSDRYIDSGMLAQAAHHLHRAPPHAAQQPVVGRRSHRVVSQRAPAASEHESMCRRQSVRQQQQQPLSIIETHSPMSERVIRSARVHQHPEHHHHHLDGAKRYPSLSVLGDYADGHLFDQQPEVGRSTRRRAPVAPATATGKRAGTRDGGAKRSSRFSSSPVLCTDPCCALQDHQSPAPMFVSEQGCLMPCCNMLPTSAESIGSPERAMRRAARRRESARDDLAAYMKPSNQQLLLTAYAYQQQQQPISASRTRRSSSLSRGDHLAAAAAGVARDRRLPTGAAMDESGQQRHLAYTQRMGRHQPITPPPVPSKPTSNNHNHQHLLMLHNQQLVHSQQQQQQDESSAAVTQMYESLAAELKAKLGNPNRAPILLPPKDYDTLSRQQGKLTGIELRRSTNPQLVGPHTSCSGELAAAPADRKEKEVAATGGGAVAHATNVESGAVCLQRSRSNSSSGLGSISLGASSPDEHAESRQSSPTSHCSPNDSARADVAFVSPSRSSCSGASNSPSSGLNSTSHGHGGETTTTTTHYYEQIQRKPNKCAESLPQPHDARRGKGIEHHNPSAVSDGVLWNGRVEIPLKVNSERRNGNTYLATKQIIY